MPQFENFYYEIDENNAVRIWDNNVVREGNPPLMFQPDYPDTTPFEDAAAAETWTVDYLTKVKEYWNANPVPQEIIDQVNAANAEQPTE